jgi:hypothetical protein
MYSDCGLSQHPKSNFHLLQVLYLVGVNHVATGLAAYVNIAPSDPIQRLGLASWDDQEVGGG